MDIDAHVGIGLPDHSDVPGEAVRAHRHTVGTDMIDERGRAQVADAEVADVEALLDDAADAVDITSELRKSLSP